MKIVKISLIALLVITVLIIAGGAVFLSTFDLNKYLDPIKAQAGQALGREVSIDRAKLDLNIFKGIVLVVDGVRVKEDSAFGGDDFIQLGQVTASVDAMAFITRREIVITHVSLQQLVVSIIRDKEGRINAQTVGPKPAEASPTATASVASNTNSPSTNSQPAMPALLVKSITISDGVIHFIDQNPAMPMKVDIRSINLAVDNFSLTDNFTARVSMAIFSSKPNVDINTQARLNLLNSAAFIEGLSIKVNTALIDMDAVRRALPALAQASLPIALTGELVIDVPMLSASAKGLEGLNAKILLDQGTLKLKEIPTTITSIHTQIDADLTRLDIRSLSMMIGQGSVNIKGAMRDYMALKPSYNVELEAKGLQAQEVIDPALAQVELSGEINGHAKIAGSSFQPAEAMENLKGNSEFTLTNGRLEKVNIANEVLGKLSQIPVVGLAVGQILSTTFNNVLKDNVTEISKASVIVDINNNQAIINALTVETNVLHLTGNGQVGLSSMDVNVANKAILSKEISDELIKRLKPLNSLTNDQGLIEIPGAVTGIVPNISYMPDMAYISKNVAKNEAAQAVGEQLDKVLEKNPEVRNILDAVLGGSNQQTIEGNVSADGAATADQSTDQQPQEEPTKKMINNLFNKILK